MRNLIKYFIKYPIASNVIMLLIIIFGTMGLSNLRKTFFPERTSKLITVQAVYPGASPLEIEQMVTLKIEDNLDGITGIKRVTSKSSENTSNVTIEINNDANNQFVLQDIKNAIDRINSFPNQMESPSIFLMENLNPAISFAINGAVSLRQLKDVAEEMEDDLKALEGISKTKISGYPIEEFSISFIFPYSINISNIFYLNYPIINFLNNNFFNFTIFIILVITSNFIIFFTCFNSSPCNINIFTFNSFIYFIKSNI